MEPFKTASLRVKENMHGRVSCNLLSYRTKRGLLYEDVPPDDSRALRFAVDPKSIRSDVGPYKMNRYTMPDSNVSTDQLVTNKTKEHES